MNDQENKPRNMRTPVEGRFRNFNWLEYEIMCRKISLAVVDRNFDRARQILNRYLFEVDEKPEISYSSSVYELGLEVRVTQALEDHGYETVQSIIRATDEQLLACRGIADKSLELIRETSQKAKQSIEARKRQMRKND